MGPAFAPHLVPSNQSGCTVCCFPPPQVRRDFTVGQNDGSCDSRYRPLASRCGGGITRTLAGLDARTASVVAVGTDPTYNIQSSLYDAQLGACGAGCALLSYMLVDWDFGCDDGAESGSPNIG